MWDWIKNLLGLTEKVEDRSGVQLQKRAIRAYTDPYRTAGSTDNNENVPYCAHCYVEVNHHDPIGKFNTLYSPCPFGASRPGQLCFDCFEIWKSDNRQYCIPYTKINKEVPARVTEFTGCGIMTSFAWEWFNPNLEPGQHPYRHHRLLDGTLTPGSGVNRPR